VSGSNRYGVCASLLELTYHSGIVSEIRQYPKVAVLRQSAAAETICQLNGWLHFMRARRWDGTRGQNSLVVPNIFLRKDATAR
jgi:hypothetical protein